MTSISRSGPTPLTVLLVLLACVPLVALIRSPGQAAAPGFAPYVEAIPNSDAKFDMVPVPGGTFMMGSPDNEPGRDADEGPRHAVKVESFWIGKFEVTWDEYDHFAFSTDEPAQQPGSATPPGGADAITRPTPSYGDEARGFGKGRQPVVDITWHAAMEYTRWLSRVTGRSYRLATEAEWEFAARAGSDAVYSFGNAAAIGEYAWYAANSKERPHPVGLKKPNKLGIHDMHGNAAEWCLDQYAPDFYKGLSNSKPDAPVVLPVSLPGETRYPHIARGGSWADRPRELRSAARRASDPEWSRRDPQSPQSIWWHTDATIVGFRVVRAVEEYPQLRGLRSQVTRNSPDR
jgi:formylglycine-generating enzyme required for sulfatase activity